MPNFLRGDFCGNDAESSLLSPLLPLGVLGDLESLGVLGDLESLGVLGDLESFTVLGDLTFGDITLSPRSMLWGSKGSGGTLGLVLFATTSVSSAPLLLMDSLVPVGLKA
jgi:hypothetical protein